MTKRAGKEGHVFPLVGKEVAQGAGCVNRWYGRMGRDEEEATQWGGDTISQLLYLPLREKSALIPWIKSPSELYNGPLQVHPRWEPPHPCGVHSQGEGRRRRGQGGHEEGDRGNAWVSNFVLSQLAISFISILW